MKNHIGFHGIGVYSPGPAGSACSVRRATDRHREPAAHGKSHALIRKDAIDPWFGIYRGQVFSPDKTPDTLAAGHAHMARHCRAVVAPVDDEVVPFGLACDGFVDRGLQGTIVVALP